MHLDRWAALTATTLACGTPVTVGDNALLDAAIASPMATAGGEDAYPTHWDKAAALLRSLVRNHPLIDGNKRAAWACCWTYLDLAGHRLAAGFDVDAAEALVLAAAAGDADWRVIAAALPQFAERPPIDAPARPQYSVPAQ